MANVRQSILLRTDLNLPKGLAEAQVAHIHFECFRKNVLGKIEMNKSDMNLEFTHDELEWMLFPYTFVHGVPNMEVLQYFIKQTIMLKVPYTEWHDTINVKVSDTQTIVVDNCLVGIALLGESDKIRTVIGDLPLLR